VVSPVLIRVNASELHVCYTDHISRARYAIKTWLLVAASLAALQGCESVTEADCRDIKESLAAAKAVWVSKINLHRLR
jgi:hypothetical protein